MSTIVRPTPLTPKLKPEVKQKWLQALRNGSYRQGQHVLRTPHDEYCCLGVLCDLVQPEQWRDIGETFWWDDNSNQKIRSVGYSHGEFLSRDVAFPAMDLLDSLIDDLSPLERVSFIDQCRNLAWMNDDGKSFAEIADYIEANF